MWPETTHRQRALRLRILDWIPSSSTLSKSVATMNRHPSKKPPFRLWWRVETWWRARKPAPARRQPSCCRLSTHCWPTIVHSNRAVHKSWLCHQHVNWLSRWVFHMFGAQWIPLYNDKILSPATRSTSRRRNFRKTAFWNRWSFTAALPLATMPPISG